MKKISCVLSTLVLTAFIMSGCEGGEKGNDKQIELPNSSEQTQQGYADDETAGGFTFTARSEWTATVSEKTRSVSWLRLLYNGAEKYSGEAGTFTLTIELDTNYSGETRTATIVIKSGNDTITITVTQQGTAKDGSQPEPPADLSGIIISALNKTAASKVLTVRIAETYTSGWPHNQDETTATLLSYDCTDSRKCLEYRVITDNKTSDKTTVHLKYLENDAVYYIQSGYDTGAKKYICGVNPEAFWDRFNHEGLLDYLDYYCDLPPRDWNKYTWTTDGSEYRAAYLSVSGKVEEEFTISLDGGRVSSISFYSFDVTDVINEKEQTTEITFEYTASPALPDGFAEGDFEPAVQRPVRIVWGEGLGESLFHTDYQPNKIGYIGLYGDYGLTPEVFQKYAPENSGKTAEYYFDESFGDPVVIGKPIYIDNDDTVIYVKWVAI